MMFALPAAVLAIAAIYLTQPNDGTIRRIASIETSMEDVSSLAGRVEALESSTEGVNAQLAGISESVAAIQAGLEDLSGQVNASAGSRAEISEKLDNVAGQVDAVSGKIGSLEQKISLLETRYNDHLRKYHDG